MGEPEISHGRGGAGNINPDNTKYVDGEIVRQGEVGSHGDGAFSTGRGGDGNIGDAGSASGPRTDTDVVPDEATRQAENEDYHVGRGGAANAHVSEEHQKKKVMPDTPMGPDTKPQVSVADKLKGKIMGVFKK